MLEIKQFDRESKGFFKAYEEEKEAGFLTYSKAGEDKIIIDHTDVNPDFKGKSVGRLLVLEAVKFAREHQIKIIPLCPYAKSVFDKSDNLRDVL